MTSDKINIRWNETPRVQWDAALGRLPHALQQSWSYGAALERAGARVLRAEIRVGGARAALAQLTARRFFGLADAAVANRGPVWLADLNDAEKAAALRALRAEAPLRRPRALIVTPDDASSAAPRLARLTQVMTGAAVAVLDLRAGAEAARAAMKGKWRNRLAAATNAPLRVRREKSLTRAGWLFDAERAQRKEKGYASTPPELAAAVEHASRGAAALWTAAPRGGGDPVAAMLFLRHGAAASYHIGWAGAAGRRLGAHNLLLWRAIEAFCADGVHTLDLGGLDTRRAPGLARFKLGAGAAPRVLCGSWI